MWLKNFCAITAATLCWLCCSLASASTPELTYIITETELSGLESRLVLLSKQTASTRLALNESKAALIASQTELSKLKTESVQLKLQLETQSSLLANANKSLQEFAQEEARTRRRIKRQRNTAIAVAVGLLAYKVFK